MFFNLGKVMPTVYAKYVVAVRISAANSFSIFFLDAILMITMMPDTVLAWRRLYQVQYLNVNGYKVSETIIV